MGGLHYDIISSYSRMSVEISSADNRANRPTMLFACSIEAALLFLLLLSLFLDNPSILHHCLALFFRTPPA